MLCQLFKGGQGTLNGVFGNAVGNTGIPRQTEAFRGHDQQIQLFGLFAKVPIAPAGRLEEEIKGTVRLDAGKAQGAKDVVKQIPVSARQDKSIFWKSTGAHT